MNDGDSAGWVRRFCSGFRAPLAAWSTLHRLGFCIIVGAVIFGIAQGLMVRLTTARLGELYAIVESLQQSVATARRAALTRPELPELPELAKLPELAQPPAAALDPTRLLTARQPNLPDSVTSPLASGRITVAAEALPRLATLAFRSGLSIVRLEPVKRQSNQPPRLNLRADGSFAAIKLFLSKLLPDSPLSRTSRPSSPLLLSGFLIRPVRLELSPVAVASTTLLDVQTALRLDADLDLRALKHNHLDFHGLARAPIDLPNAAVSANTAFKPESPRNAHETLDPFASQSSEQAITASAPMRLLGLLSLGGRHAALVRIGAALELLERGQPLGAGAVAAIDETSVTVRFPGAAPRVLNLEPDS